METGRNVMHYALGDNQDYENEWSKAVLEYLENGYSSEDSKSEVEVGNATYKILLSRKRLLDRETCKQLFLYIKFYIYFLI